MYLKSGMFTSLSSDTGSTISNFFTKNEHFYFWEGGVSGLARTGIPVQARGPMDANNIHLTGWYRNPTNGTPQSYGVAFNANRMIGSQYMWFVRSGWSVGHFNNWALSGGLGWRPAKTTADLFGAAFGWTRPTVPVPGGLRSQYTAETFYRFHVTTPNFGHHAGFPVDPAPGPESQGGHHVGNQCASARCFLTYGFRRLALERFRVQCDFLFACGLFLPIFADPGFEGLASGRIAAGEGKGSDVGIRDGELGPLG